MIEALVMAVLDKASFLADTILKMTGEIEAPHASVHTAAAEMATAARKKKDWNITAKYPLKN